MPMLIEHIDAIARQKQRDVLFLEFNSPRAQERFDEIGRREDQRCDWRSLRSRLNIICWLDAQNIVWKPCGDFANINCMTPYRGQIYIDIPFETSSPEFKSLDAHLEFPDGKSRFDGVTFFYLPLAKAMENAAHDEPGFWERWAETF